jgi:hypothetical protein
VTYAGTTDRTATLNTGAVCYINPMICSIPGTVENLRQTRIFQNGVLRNLYVALDGSPGVGKSYTFTVRLNGVNTALTCIIAEANTTGSNVADVVDVNAGDILSVAVTPAGVPTARNLYFIYLEHNMR